MRARVAVPQVVAAAELAELGRILSSPTRLAILTFLAQADCCICQEITEMSGYSQPTISKHLAELRKAGLVCVTAEGTTRKYCINAQAWQHARQVMVSFFDQMSACCN